MSPDRQYYLEPIVVISDRYTGAYSGGKWVAFGRGDLPFVYEVAMDKTQDGDFECSEFWTDEMKALTGQGGTPDEAVVNLRTKAATLGEGAWFEKWIEYEYTRRESAKN